MRNDWMSRFHDIYLKIVNEQARPSNNELRDFSETVETIYPASEWFLDLHRIVLETVKAAELTPVPDDVLIECYRNLDLVSNGCFKLPYSRIIEIVEESSYELSDVFTKCLRRYAEDLTGNLYVFRGKLDDVSEAVSDVRSTGLYKRMAPVVEDDDRVYEFISALMNAGKVDGLTIIKRDISFEDHKDCLVWVSPDANFKDVMEHEMTHFIQRVCQFDESLPKVYDHSFKNGFQKRICESGE